tara:strand:+ start:1231 stop:1470 length:240 start_codon:yes stop_codon:yes gene_type:complete
MKDKKYVWLASIPEIAGVGISIISDTKKNAEKMLKKAYYDIKRDCWYGQEYNTYKGAFEYFGGSISKIYFNEIYDNQLR